MRGQILLIGSLLIAIMLGGVVQAMPQQDAADGTAVVPGEYLVKFTPGSIAAQRKATVQDLGGQIIDRIGALDIEVVHFPQASSGNKVQAAGIVRAFEHNPLVEYIQPNYIYTTSNGGGRIVYLPQVVGPTTLQPSDFKPNDPSLSSQYAWTRLSAFKGWAYTQGSSNVVVAIVDTGIQLNHPDLREKIVAGYDFVDSDRTADDLVNGHGTHVAGIVAASTNNNVGVAGTCPNCKLMPIRVLDNNGSGNTSDVTDGIVYAAENGAKVINLSLGGTYDDPTMEAAINYAWQQGAVVTCAAGNTGNIGNPINYPGYYDNCLAVGATDSNDNHASYSQYGTWVDIAAPGTAIYSTWAGGAYDYESGTSMATPYVSGVAGLLAGQGLTNQQIRDRIQSRADQITGTGRWWSNGRLNLFRAVTNQ